MTYKKERKRERKCMREKEGERDILRGRGWGNSIRRK